MVKQQDPPAGNLGLDTVRDLGARGGQLLAGSRRRGAALLAADQATARGEQSSTR